MEFTDKTLTCVDCGEDFLFSAGEQRFFADRDFRNDPKRCKACKSRRTVAAPTETHIFLKRETLATCNQCGRQTTLPFRPTQGRPVFCRECFQHRRMVAMA